MEAVVTVGLALLLVMGILGLLTGPGPGPEPSDWWLAAVFVVASIVAVWIVTAW